MEIKQVVYNYETVPTELRAMVDDVLITYKRTCSAPYPGFRMIVENDTSKEKAEKVARVLIDRIIDDHNESEHGVSWKLMSFDYMGRDTLDRREFAAYYRVRDSY